MNERDQKLWEQALYDGERFDSAESCFADLIRADEREACADICDLIRGTDMNPSWDTAAAHCASAIRARGNT
jgi:hypothetical protein